jgi:hypothetical protein
MEVLQRTIRPLQTIFEYRILSFDGSRIRSSAARDLYLRDEFAQVPIPTLAQRIDRVKDLVRFFRPVDFSGDNVPAEAAGEAYGLPLSELSLAAFQSCTEGLPSGTNGAETKALVLKNSFTRLLTLPLRPASASVAPGAKLPVVYRVAGPNSVPAALSREVTREYHQHSGASERLRICSSRPLFISSACSRRPRSRRFCA